MELVTGSFIYPNAVAVDGTGHVWVVDGYSNNRIEEFAPVPEPSTLALLGVGAISLLAYAWRSASRLVHRVKDNAINPLRHAVSRPGLREAGHYPRPNRFWRPAGVAVGDNQDRVG